MMTKNSEIIFKITFGIVDSEKTFLHYTCLLLIARRVSCRGCLVLRLTFVLILIIYLRYLTFLTVLSGP